MRRLGDKLFASFIIVIAFYNESLTACVRLSPTNFETPEDRLVRSLTAQQVTKYYTSNLLSVVSVEIPVYYAEQTTMKKCKA